MKSQIYIYLCDNQHCICEFDPASTEVTPVQLYMLKFVSYLQKFALFLFVLSFPFVMKMTTTILLTIFLE
jgi:hypothetical protein